MEEYLGRNIEESFRWLKENPIDHPDIRPYQKEAIESIEAEILRSKSRMILAMATGTGKTFTAAELIYRSGFRLPSEHNYSQSVLRLPGSNEENVLVSRRGSIGEGGE
ncbi:MAG: DEAD/DEAH box helicase family protein [Nitrososphaeraceae archaeon]